MRKTVLNYSLIAILFLVHMEMNFAAISNCFSNLLVSNVNYQSLKLLTMRHIIINMFSSILIVVVWI